MLKLQTTTCVCVQEPWPDITPKKAAPETTPKQARIASRFFPKGWGHGELVLSLVRHRSTHACCCCRRPSFFKLTPPLLPSWALAENPWPTPWGHAGAVPSQSTDGVVTPDSPKTDLTHTSPRAQNGSILRARNELALRAWNELAMRAACVFHFKASPKQARYTSSFRARKRSRWGRFFGSGSHSARVSQSQPKCPQAPGPSTSKIPSGKLNPGTLCVEKRRRGNPQSGPPPSASTLL